MMASIQNLLQVFHFLRPWWLLALPVLWALVLWLARQRNQHSNAAQFIDADLLPALRLDTTHAAGSGTPGMRPWPWLALISLPAMRTCLKMRTGSLISVFVMCAVNASPIVRWVISSRSNPMGSLPGMVFNFRPD